MEKLNNCKKQVFDFVDFLKEYHNSDLKNFSKDFLACGLSALSLATPMYAFLETVFPKIVNKIPEISHFFPDMTSEDSIELRLGLSPFILLGGYIADKLRIKSRRKAKGNNSIGHHDGSFGTKLGFLTNIIPYGIKFGDLSKTGILTSFSIPIYYVIGRAEGFTMDFFKHVIKNEAPTERIPKKLWENSRKIKISLAGLIFATSIALTAGVYKTSDYLSESKEKKEEKVGNLEKISLRNDAFHFRIPLKDYSAPADGLRVCNSKNF
ncbi:hypothetical protein COU58_02225 [Candidatus Pacearchaeota archaeon CG10_big_fil_rev_8_21_14_0_10_32_42]|nr:MAG: hypothetical protein COU58_02225 [Candidatus Pacearchaeota archaeon CG10_big_fil_rev_8_21_14_0_10_32_42]